MYNVLMNRGVSTIVVLLGILGALIIGAAGYFYLNNNQSQNVSPPVPVVRHVATTTRPSVSTAISTSSSPKPSSPTAFPEIIASSSAQVGMFTVVENCNDGIPMSLDILKDGSLVQTIIGKSNCLNGFGPGVNESSCIPPESQDVNFDGYSDILIAVDGGSGGESDEYWLFDTTTQQFDNSGYLMNPHFNSASKIITSTDYNGASETDIQTYQAVDGKLVFVKEVDMEDVGPDSNASAFVTVKEPVDGKMQVVSTSTVDAEELNQLLSD